MPPAGPLARVVLRSSCMRATIRQVWVRMRAPLAILILAGHSEAWAATNSTPALILKGVRDTNAPALQWSPWSCWWLLPPTNSNRDSREPLTEVGEAGAGTNRTNSTMVQTNADLAATNFIAAGPEPNPGGGSQDLNVSFGASMISGRPIGRRNVQIGQPNVQTGPGNVQLGQPNAQIGKPAAQSGSRFPSH